MKINEKIYNIIYMEFKLILFHIKEYTNVKIIFTCNVL